MRKNKFRIWEVYNKCFSKVPFGFGLNRYFELSCPDDSFDGETRKFVYQQCTDVKDKNGTEIYEGDIVKYKGFKGIVSFISGMFVLDYDDESDSGPIGFLLTLDMEVVGNIFEN